MEATNTGKKTRQRKTDGPGDGSVCAVLEFGALAT